MAGKREQAAITQVEARTAAQASHADSGEPKLVSTAKRRNKAAMPARKMNDEERAAHERKLIKSNAAMIAFGYVPAGRRGAKRKEFRRGPELEEQYQFYVAALGAEAAEAAMQEAWTEHWTQWERVNLPHPWNEVQEVQRHFELTKALDIQYKLMSFWRRWARLWWTGARSSGLSSLPTYAVPLAQSGRSRSWKRTPKVLPPDDASHPIGDHAQLKGLFLTASYPEQEVAVGLTKAATGSVPVWMVPVPTEERRRRKPSGKAMSAAERKRKQRAKDKAA